MLESTCIFVVKEMHGFFLCVTNLETIKEEYYLFWSVFPLNCIPYVAKNLKILIV